MVTFKDDSFIIEVRTAGNPIEEWLNLHQQLTFILSQCEEPASSAHYLISLLDDMMPDWETALKMNPFNKKQY
jgi:hypothetical protein